MTGTIFQQKIDETKSLRGTEELRFAVDRLLARKFVRSGRGPAMAYFEDADTNERYVYVLFGVSGIRGCDEPQKTADSYDELEKSFIAVLGEWLQPGKTLVWRVTPECAVQGNRWAVYARCVQLPDDRDSINIKWSF